MFKIYGYRVPSFFWIFQALAPLVLQHGQSGDGLSKPTTLCKYNGMNCDLFVMSDAVL